MKKSPVEIIDAEFEVIREPGAPPRKRLPFWLGVKMILAAPGSDELPPGRARNTTQWLETVITVFLIVGVVVAVAVVGAVWGLLWPET